MYYAPIRPLAALHSCAYMAYAVDTRAHTRTLSLLCSHDMYTLSGCHTQANATIKEVIWGIVELISAGSTDGSYSAEPAAQETSSDTEEPALLEDDFPSQFGTCKKRKRKRAKSVPPPTETPVIPGMRVQLPCNRNHMCLENNIFMGLYDEQWFACRVYGVGPSGASYSVVEYFGYSGTAEASSFTLGDLVQSILNTGFFFVNRFFVQRVCVTSRARTGRRLPGKTIQGVMPHLDTR